VDDLSLDIERGEFFSLLGPSGCGKTTTLRMIGGFEEVTTGTVYLGDVDVTDRPPHKRDVNTVFQNYALFPHLDIFENVAFGLRRHKVADDEVARRVGEMLELVELPNVERRKPNQLSGGQQQRVALARALINQPKVLLLDEPLGALDRNLRDRLVPELGGLFRRVGVTVVHVTHDQEEALALADRVVVMDAGAVVQEGTPEDLWARPATPFVARFLGFANVTEGAEGARLVRPDAVRLRPAGPDDGGTAGVVSVLFHGGRSAVTVRLPDGTHLEASVPTGDGIRWRVGDRASVELDPAGVQRLG
jgi:spermidine/putrescine transport system ATP-binding protein